MSNSEMNCTNDTCFLQSVCGSFTKFSSKDNIEISCSGGSRGCPDTRLLFRCPFLKEHILKTCRYGFQLNRVLREHKAGTIGT